jgi:hypothetical protein
MLQKKLEQPVVKFVIQKLDQRLKGIEIGKLPYVTEIIKV